jgi:hypothetical protein
MLSPRFCYVRRPGDGTTWVEMGELVFVLLPPRRRVDRLSISPKHVINGTGFEPELARIVAAWPTLPEPVKASIRALVGTIEDCLSLFVVGSFWELDWQSPVREQVRVVADLLSFQRTVQTGVKKRNKGSGFAFQGCRRLYVARRGIPRRTIFVSNPLSGLLQQSLLPERTRVIREETARAAKQLGFGTGL